MSTTEIQFALSRLGYEPGRMDGQTGPRTQAALDAAGLRGRSDADALSELLRRVADAGDDVHEVSIEEMRALAPKFPRAWLYALNASLTYGLITRARLPMFLAQLGHESAGFSTLEEFASGAAYEGRADLGNVRNGDGIRYKGRGVIQLTGRSNYRRYGALLGVNLEERPEQAAEPRLAFQIAALYWLDRGLNAPTDAGDLEAVTRRINGGLNGLADRRARLEAAQRLFSPGTEGALAPSPELTAAPTLTPDADTTWSDLDDIVFDEHDDEEPTVIAPPPTPAPRALVTPPEPSPAPPRPSPVPPAPTAAVEPPAPEVIPMPTREERAEKRDARQDRRKQQREAVRAEFRANSARWIGRYREIFQDELEEGSSEREAHETALREALNSFVEWSIHLLARVRFSRNEDRWRLIADEGKRAAFRELVSRTFLRALRTALQDMQEAREAAALLTDRAADIAGAASDFLGAFSDLLDDDPPQVVTGSPTPREPVRTRTPADLPRDRILDPGIPVMEAPSRSPLMSRPAEDEIIEIPE